MNSYNHYAYGSIADFMYNKIGGITQILPGYKKFKIQPFLDTRISCAETSLDTVFGLIKTSWKVCNNEFKLTVTVPCNTTAEIVLPDNSVHSVGSGIYKYNIKV